MKLFKTTKGILILHRDNYYVVDSGWDELVNQGDLYSYLLEKVQDENKLSVDVAEKWIDSFLLPPIGQQEVWAAGVTYLRSRDARMEESLASGGATLYDRIYDADRPELFFKSLPHRVHGHGQTVYIRRDSTWNVPEPECTLFINSRGEIRGYTIGNDMSSRSIEGENALYLPQAKVYERSAAIGPCLYVPENPLPVETGISMVIMRNGLKMYDDATTVSQMKRKFGELAEYLYAECDFPVGAYLMTGTCLVPGNDFTLQEGDVVRINIEGIGETENVVGCKARQARDE